ncbi:Uncharacterised protein [Vibrio alginolyticus]|uniref:Uncharacterized protein n=1 Tax=Vibrio alginolyticus (strain ATCC 17749 / DSM 2171 / NBRC 15630 / NCIMB 1903 / NCTC 12160 / XII-53) TaxID=1219076 RepID=A0A2I3C463_VIBAX|nr:hypothetical protein N646_0610 [Vibrio alginolyticus NBRC 15630 = ATCC 17749]SQA44146.1 Uncharacterised protein [Vibrio alginolyticus]
MTDDNKNDKKPSPPPPPPRPPGVRYVKDGYNHGKDKTEKKNRG